MKRSWVTYHSVNSYKHILLQYVVKFSKFLGVRCGSVVFILHESPRFYSRGVGGGGGGGEKEAGASL